MGIMSDRNRDRFLTHINIVRQQQLQLSMHDVIKVDTMVSSRRLYQKRPSMVSMLVILALRRVHSHNAAHPLRSMLVCMALSLSAYN